MYFYTLYFSTNKHIIIIIISAQTGLSAQRPPSLRKSPDPSTHPARLSLASPGYSRASEHL